MTQETNLETPLEDPAPECQTTDKVQELEAALSAAQDRVLRALAEVDNAHKRAARDRQEAKDYAITSFARDVLMVADTLDRALASAPDKQTPFARGVTSTADILHAALVRHGVSKIDALGMPFDPEQHEVLMEIPAQDGTPPGIIVQVLEEGYTLRERLLRPSRVAVAGHASEESDYPPEAGSQLDTQA